MRARTFSAIGEVETVPTTGNLRIADRPAAILLWNMLTESFNAKSGFRQNSHPLLRADHCLSFDRKDIQSVVRLCGGRPTL